MNLTAPPDFEEADYLAANPDVADAVAAGQIQSGLAHYLRYGANENRSLRPGVRGAPFSFPFQQGLIPQRRDKILAGLDLPGMTGVEIGALTRPLVTKLEGDIFYVDHADTATLRDQYRQHAWVDTKLIVDVDGVWGEKTLQECIGHDRMVDYVVASHVIEHAPDLITWLAEIRTILRPGGTLRLAIPDCRYTFDYLRFESRLHDVLDAYLRKTRTPLPRQIIEHHTLIRTVDAKAAWDGTLDVARLESQSNIQNGLDLARDALANGTYHDVHCWIFTPVSFAELCHQLATIDLLGFACNYHIETPRHDSEFYVCMIANNSRDEAAASWADMAALLRTSPTYQRRQDVAGNYRAFASNR